MTHSIPNRPLALLWDMDGTIVDTEPYWIDAEAELVRRHGGSWSHEQGLAMVGNALDKTARMLQQAGVDEPAGEIIEWLSERVAQRVARDPRYRPGARELLAQGQEQDRVMAMVTMSFERLAVAVCETLPANTFATRVTGDQVVRGKPDPECYLLACERLGVRPSDALAIEDSPTGAAAAGAAGIPTLAVKHLVDVPARAGRVVIDTLAGHGADDLDQAWHTARESMAHLPSS